MQGTERGIGGAWDYLFWKKRHLGWGDQVPFKPWSDDVMPYFRLAGGMPVISVALCFLLHPDLFPFKRDPVLGFTSCSHNQILVGTSYCCYPLLSQALPTRLAACHRGLDD